MIIYSYYVVDIPTSLDEKETVKKLLESVDNYVGPPGIVYSSDRYELVEKKDWKIKKINEGIDYYKERIELHKKLIDLYAGDIDKYTKTIKTLEESIKALEEE